MQIKKWIATGLAALMAGATLAGSALAAASLSGFPGFLASTSASGSSLNALIVVGDNAAAADVVGSVNVAARLAQLSYTSQTASSAAGTVSYTDGVSLNTQNSNLHLGDNVNSYKSTITSTDLPNELASGTVSDTSGNTYSYNQYLTVSAVPTAYGTPGSLTSPVLYVNYGSTNYPVQAKVVFTNPLPIDTTTFGESISLFGNTYAIGSQSLNDTGGATQRLVLFGGSNDVTIDAGSSQTVTVGGTSYAISVPGVNGQVSPATATVTVNGQSQLVEQGNSYTIGGLLVYVKTLTAYTAPTAGGLVELLAGANQLNLVTGTDVTTGSISSPTSTITGSTTTLTMTSDHKLSQFTVDLPTPSTTQYVAQGSTWTDPVFGSITETFTGTTPSGGDTLSFTAPSSTTAAVNFMDNHGNSATVTFAYNNSNTINLADGSGNPIHVLENESAKSNEYVMLDAGNFTHMFKVSSITNATSSAAGQVTLSDVFSGATVSLSTGSVGTDSGTVYIDGQSYTMTINQTSGNQVAFDWHGANEFSVFPFLQTTNGNYVAFGKNQTISVSGNTTTTKLDLPTGQLSITNGTASATQVVGNVGYITTVLPGASGYTITTALNATTPSVLIWEEPTGTDPAKNEAITVSTAASSTSPAYVTFNQPTFTNSFSSGLVEASGTTTYTGYDNFGSYVTFNQPSGSAASATIVVPSVQSVVNVGVGGTSIAASTSGSSTGGTYNVVSPVTTAVGLLASEVTPAQEAADNVVLVGGPCANSLVQSLVDNGQLGSQYTCAGGTPGSAWTPGTAYVLLVNDAFASGKVALVVAGTDAADTRLATSVLQNYDSTNVAGKLTGTAVKISGTDYTTASITAA